MVVDDHEVVVCLGVERALTGAGLAEVVQWHPDLAFIPSSARPDGDSVVLLDLWLADGSGPRENLAAPALRGAPVVVDASADDPDLVREVIAGVALSIVRKSAPLSVLVGAVRSPRRSRGRRHGAGRAAPLRAPRSTPRPRVVDPGRRLRGLLRVGARRADLPAVPGSPSPVCPRATPPWTGVSPRGRGRARLRCA